MAARLYTLHEASSWGRNSRLELIWGEGERERERGSSPALVVSPGVWQAGLEHGGCLQLQVLSVHRHSLQSQQPGQGLVQHTGATCTQDPIYMSVHSTTTLHEARLRMTLYLFWTSSLSLTQSSLPAPQPGPHPLPAPQPGPHCSHIFCG